MNPQILFKQHDNIDCDTLLNISRYLYAKYKIDIRPSMIIERNFPQDIKVLPSILINNKLIEGINNIVIYYENFLKLNDLKNLSAIFCKNNPNYRITDLSTHKKIIF